MEKVTKDSNVLIEAVSIVFGDREADYDHPIKDFVGTALNMTSYLRRKLKQGEVISVMDVPMLVACIKLSRESYKHTKDNGRDMAGYVLTQERVESFLDDHNLRADDLLGILKEI